MATTNHVVANLKALTTTYNISSERLSSAFGLPKFVVREALKNPTRSVQEKRVKIIAEKLNIPIARLTGGLISFSPSNPPSVIANAPKKGKHGHSAARKAPKKQKIATVTRAAAHKHDTHPEIDVAILGLAMKKHGMLEREARNVANTYLRLLAAFNSVS